MITYYKVDTPVTLTGWRNGMIKATRAYRVGEIITDAEREKSHYSAQGYALRAATVPIKQELRSKDIIRIGERDYLRREILKPEIRNAYGILTIAEIDMDANGLEIEIHGNNGEMIIDTLQCGMCFRAQEWINAWDDGTFALHNKVQGDLMVSFRYVHRLDMVTVTQVTGIYNYDIMYEVVTYEI